MALEQMSHYEFRCMIDRREDRMARSMGFKSDWFNGHGSDVYNTLFPESLIVHNPRLHVRRIFNETTNAIGEEWLWTNGYFYFVREQDATWFRLRWL